jgi:hypothetical protein
VMTVCGKARSSRLMTEYQLSSAKKVNQLQSARSAKVLLIVFMIAQRCHATQLTYCVPSVLKK